MDLTQVLALLTDDTRRGRDRLLPPFAAPRLIACGSVSSVGGPKSDATNAADRPPSASS